MSNSDSSRGGISRRDFVKLTAASGAAMAAGIEVERPVRAAESTRPNFLFITTDQQGLDTLSAYGCTDVRTPNLDRLAERGVSFMESYCANPLCSPSRSSLFTGRMSSETGVIQNELPIRSDIPDLGQWLGTRGYDCFYFGKWHMPAPYTLKIPGFTVLPGGNNGKGSLLDGCVSRACEAFLRNRTGSTPFLAVASFLQPHDICEYISWHTDSPDVLPYPEIADCLPPLPSNFNYDPREPKGTSGVRNYHKVAAKWDERQWCLYLYYYYRMVEEADAQVGRLLQVLDESGHADNTIVIFTSDHGEGRGRHNLVTKNFLYDEATKVPLIVSCPGRLPSGSRIAERLVSGIDIMPTICDYAGIGTPAKTVGRSLRPLLEGKRTEWREFVVAEVKANTGHMIRTADYKYITFQNDPVVQFYDMKHDPGETKNLYEDPRYAAALADHRKLLETWNAKLDAAPNTTARVPLLNRTPAYV